MNDDRLHPDALSIRQGRWQFDLRGDEVAEIKFDGVRLLRGVRPVVRDQDWNTVPVRVREQRLAHRHDSSTAVIDLEFTDGQAVHYDATLTLSTEPTSLTISFRGVSRSAFDRDRIGLVVLHPVEDAGQEVECLSVDGTITASRWPEHISPHQPFRRVAGFSWTRRGVRADLRLDGDTFETEDQRNWTDASFKTYSTPLDLPFPVPVRPGDEVTQSVVLTCRRLTAATALPAPSAEPLVITAGGGDVVPEIAVGASAPTSADSVRPRSVEPWGAVLVELTGDPASWPTVLATAEEEAQALGTRVDVRVVSAHPAHVRAAVAHPTVQRARRLAVFDPQRHITTAPLWQALTEEAARTEFDGQLVAGARSHFTELNRRFDEVPDEPPLTFSITPQMHATEVAHIVDSLEGQRLVARNAARLAGGRVLHIGPITLRQRFNAVATTTDAVPPPPDPLQDTDFAAAWTLGSIAALTGPAVQSLTYAVVSGPGGLHDQGGNRTPAGELLHRIGALSGHPVLTTHAPPGAVGYAVDRGDSTEVFLANLTDRSRLVQVYAASTPAQIVPLTPWCTAVVSLTPLTAPSMKETTS